MKDAYKAQTAQLIYRQYPLIAGILLLALLAYCVSDIYIHKEVIFAYTRILPIVFCISLVFSKFLKIKRSEVLLLLANALAISLLFMAVALLLLNLESELFNTAIIALVICAFAAYYFAKGEKYIYWVYLIPFLFLIVGVGYLGVPEKIKLQHLMNPIIIYLGILSVSIITERQRFKQFVLQEELAKEKYLTEELLEETTVQNQQLSQQKEEILTINEKLEANQSELLKSIDEISELNRKLNKKNQDITSSINYALKIQQAILPTHQQLSSIVNDYFILYNPSNIVSGDFYWALESENRNYIATIDCTGHGVPGGFLSMLSYSLINEIVINNEGQNANDILLLLSQKMLNIFKKNNDKVEQVDAMDIGICIIEKDNSKLQFAGANMPLIVLRDNKVISFKGDTMPIGRYITKRNEYKNYIFDIQANDKFYLYSDGYKDQMGGMKNKRLMSKPFINLLFNYHHLTFEEQKVCLQEYFDNWKGKNDQLDDLMVLGFSLK